MQVAAACLAEGKEACHKAITVDDLHSTGGASRVPPRHRGRLAIRLRDSRALRGAHLLLRHLGALPRLRLLRETRAQPGHLVGEPRRLHVLHLLLLVQRELGRLALGALRRLGLQHARDQILLQPVRVEATALEGAAQLRHEKVVKHSQQLPPQ